MKNKKNYKNKLKKKTNLCSNLKSIKMKSCLSIRTWKVKYKSSKIKSLKDVFLNTSMVIFSILTLFKTLNGLSTPSKSTQAEKSDPHCSSAKWTLRTKTTSTITSTASQTSS